MKKSIPAFVLIVLAILVAVWFCRSVFKTETPVVILPPDPRPNIVLINLDDADYKMFAPDMLKLYPGFEQLAKRSVSFTNLHVTTPFCGPSRAALFRGQYAHQTGVRVNIPDLPLAQGYRGGYEEFLRQGHDHDELGVWLKRGGYRTILLGKYHHSGFDFKKPEGYDDFYTTNGGRYLGAFKFTTETDPQGKSSQDGEDVYRTDREANDAVKLIGQHVARRKAQTEKGQVAQPFFFYYAPLAPHRPIGNDFTKMVDDTKYADWQSDLKIPQTPDFNEANMFDKPAHRQSAPYSEKELATLHSEHRCRARAVKSVDDFVLKMIAELKAKGMYENTYFLITSDNGYQLGHHRLLSKLDPYRMSTTAPLFVSGPEVDKQETANHLLAHIDLCPTILDLAECAKPEFLDGKSFVDLIRDPVSHDEKTWREPVILENWQVKRNRGEVSSSMYSGLRYHDQLYIEWANGVREFYDLANDPYELNNAYDSLSDNEKTKLREDVFAARSVKMDPIVTLLQRPVLTEHLGFPWCLRGAAEDDRSVEKIELVIRHKRRGYWNGSSWSQARVNLQANDFVPDQQLVSWRYDIRDAISKLTMQDAEVVDGRRIFRIIAKVKAWDNLGNGSEDVQTHLLMPFTRNPFAVRVAKKQVRQTIK